VVECPTLDSELLTASNLLQGHNFTGSYNLSFIHDTIRSFADLHAGSSCTRAWRAVGQQRTSSNACISQLLAAIHILPCVAFRIFQGPLALRPTVNGLRVKSKDFFDPTTMVRQYRAPLERMVE
jgi:hypothetical protein